MNTPHRSPLGAFYRSTLGVRGQVAVVPEDFFDNFPDKEDLPPYDFTPAEACLDGLDYPPGATITYDWWYYDHMGYPYHPGDIDFPLIDSWFRAGFGSPWPSCLSVWGDKAKWSMWTSITTSPQFVVRLVFEKRAFF